MCLNEAPPFCQRQMGMPNAPLPNQQYSITVHLIGQSIPRGKQEMLMDLYSRPSNVIVKHAIHKGVCDLIKTEKHLSSPVSYNRLPGRKKRVALSRLCNMKRASSHKSGFLVMKLLLFSSL